MNDCVKIKELLASVVGMFDAQWLPSSPALARSTTKSTD